jgi:hypothetical protein
VKKQPRDSTTKERGPVTAIYVTVDYLGRVPVASRPLCQGCTPVSVDGQSAPIILPDRAEYQIVGASGTIDLCRRCAIHSIKSLAARFVMFDPSATRDLMDFFAAEAPKKRPAARRKRRASKVLEVIDVPVTKLLTEPRKSGRP